MLKGREFSSAAEIWDLLLRVRGHNMAKGGVEAAIWDAEARSKKYASLEIAGRHPAGNHSGVSIGLQVSLEVLAKAVKKELDAGYQRIKIKIKPGQDIELVRRLRQEFPTIKLMVDANSAYRIEDWAKLKEFDAYYLMMIEQPLGWDDLFGHIELQKRLNTPICLDECIHSEEQALAAVTLGACKIINIKLGRVGGFTPAKRIHNICQQNSVPVWCGGMLETGIGRAHNIALSTLPNFTLPGDVTASKRYWEEDIIDPEVSVTPRGTIDVPQGPGIGFEPRRERIEKLATRTERLK